MFLTELKKRDTRQRGKSQTVNQREGMIFFFFTILKHKENCSEHTQNKTPGMKNKESKPTKLDLAVGQVLW